MKRTEFIAALQQEIGEMKVVKKKNGTTNYTLFSKEEIEVFMDAYESVILDALRRGERVHLHGFLRFERKIKKAHQGYDFQNKCHISVPESETIGVELGKKFSCLLNKDN